MSLSSLTINLYILSARSFQLGFFYFHAKFASFLFICIRKLFCFTSIEYIVVSLHNLDTKKH
jgi:hypothetical protein